MTYSKSPEDITKNLITKGKRIEKATCVTQFFAEDGLVSRSFRHWEPTMFGMIALHN